MESSNQNMFGESADNAQYQVQENQQTEGEGEQVTEEQVRVLSDELFKEAKTVVANYRSFKYKTWSLLEDDVYMISREWMKKWKHYAQYKRVKRNYNVEYTYEHLKKEHPGQINNETLLKDFTKYFREENLEDPTNYAIKSKIREGYEYKLLPKDVWSIFQQKYGGFEIKRFKDTDYYSRKYILRFPAIKLLVLPPYNILIPDQLPKKKKIFMLPTQKFKEVKHKLVRCLNQEYQKSGNTESILSNDGLRLWKANFNYNTKDKIADFLKEHSIGGVETKFVEPQVVDDDMEENTGVSFPGQQLETYLEKTYSEVEKNGLSISSYFDLVVVEQQSQDKKFIFQYNKNPALYGKCEACYSYNTLKVTCVCKKVSYCNEACRQRDENYHQNHCDAVLEMDLSTVNFKQNAGAKMGVVGLSNLGNTCFMNSALQCLSNTFPLTQYFLDGHFIPEINKDNALGSGGVLAFLYANLLNDMWNKSSSVVTPSQLKRQCGKQNVMFQGMNQHDSQEFVNFLLDSLHEDLNRVKTKPYVELPESNNRPDEIVAKEFWVAHLRRNQSVIVDLMHGQQKSTLTCPNCGKISVTFDPYMSIPLPIPQHFTYSFFYLPYKVSKKIFQAEIQIKASDSILGVKQKICLQAQTFYNENVGPYDFVLAQIDKSDFSIYQIFTDDMSASVLSVNLNNYYMFAFSIFGGAKNLQFLEQEQQQYYIPLKSKEQKQQEEEEIESKNKAKKLYEDDFEEQKETPTIDPSKEYSDYYSLPVPRFIPLRQIQNQHHIKVPLNVTLRTQRQINSHYNSYNHGNKYYSKEYIPRLIWLNLDQKLVQILRHVYILYAFLMDVQEGNEAENFEAQYSQMLEKINNGEEISENELNVDQTQLPMILNVINPNKNKYFAPNCRVCGQKNCNNCPFPFWKDITLREFLEDVTHQTKFEMNDNLFKSYDQLREEQNNSNSDNEESKSNFNGSGIPKPPKNNWTSPSINNDNDIEEEDKQQANNDTADEQQDLQDKNKKSNAGRHKVFQLELCLINRRIEKPVEYFNKVLMGFDSHPFMKKGNSSSKGKHHHDSQSLQDCLDFFRKSQKLDKDNAWYCNICKDHVEATKKIELYSTPPIMIFCFQRFKSHNIYFKEKLEEKINFPVTDLDMSSFIVSEKQKATVSSLYDLYAVSNHYGSLAFGHYTAYCKNPRTGIWHDFNDSMVSELNGPQDAVSSAAYVLYYKRKDFFPEAPVDFSLIKQTLDEQQELLTNSQPTKATSNGGGGIQMFVSMGGGVTDSSENEGDGTIQFQDDMVNQNYFKEEKLQNNYVPLKQTNDNEDENESMTSDSNKDD